MLLANTTRWSGFPIPKGLHHPAQGCEQRATLGRHVPYNSATLKELNPNKLHLPRSGNLAHDHGHPLAARGVLEIDATPSELKRNWTAQPSVGRLRRPTLGWMIQSLRDWRRGFGKAPGQGHACCPFLSRLGFQDGYGQIPRPSDAQASTGSSHRPRLWPFAGNCRSGRSRGSAGVDNALREHIHHQQARLS